MVNDRGGLDWPPNYCSGDGRRDTRLEVNSWVVGQEGWAGERGGRGRIGGERRGWEEQERDEEERSKAEKKTGWKRMEGVERKKRMRRMDVRRRDFKKFSSFSKICSLGEWTIHPNKSFKLGFLPKQPYVIHLSWHQLHESGPGRKVDPSCETIVHSHAVVPLYLYLGRVTIANVVVNRRWIKKSQLI